MKTLKLHSTHIILFIIHLLYIQSSFSQSQFSLSGNGGLIVIDGHYGGAVSAKLGMSLGKTTGLELGYHYIEIASNDPSAYQAHRYSLVGEQFLFSNDNKFRISGKIGPSLMVYRGHTNDNPLVGLDFGLESSFRVFDFLHIDFGLINTLNKEGFMAQTYVGFSWDFNLKKEDSPNQKKTE